MKTLIGTMLHVTDESLCEKLAEYTVLEHYKKDDTILRIGEQQTHIRFLVDGAVRFFYLDELETEHTQCFVNEPGYPVMVDAYAAPIYSGCHAIKDTTVLALPAEAGYGLMATSPELMAFYNYVLRKSMFFHAEIAMVLRAGDAQRRYRWFLSAFPGLEQDAKSRHIASFLCITPETLSRVRAKGVEQEQFHGQMRLPKDERSFNEIRENINEDSWEETLKEHDLLYQ